MGPCLDPSPDWLSYLRWMEQPVLDLSFPISNRKHDSRSISKPVAPWLGEGTDIPGCRFPRHFGVGMASATEEGPSSVPLQPLARGSPGSGLRAPPPTALASGSHVLPYPHPIFSPNAQLEGGSETRKFPLPKSSGVDCSEGHLESPPPRPVTFGG